MQDKFVLINFKGSIIKIKEKELPAFFEENSED